MRPLFKADVFAKEIDRFNFNGIQEYLVFNPFEGQIDTGNMMEALLKLAIANNILILNQQTVTEYQENENGVRVATSDFDFQTKKLFLPQTVLLET